jgi:hypothetical protein
MIARDSPLKGKFTGSEAAIGNFTSLALTENSEFKRIKEFRCQASKKEISYGRKPRAPTSGYRAYVAKSFRYFACGAVFCFPWVCAGFIRGRESRYWSYGEVHIWYYAPPTSRFQREPRPLST